MNFKTQNLYKLFIIIKIGGFNMALGTCPDCNGKLSSTAKFCPHCGYDAEGARIKSMRLLAPTCSCDSHRPCSCDTYRSCSCYTHRPCSCDDQCDDCMWNCCVIE